MTLREAITKISPINVSVDWISRIEGSEKRAMLDQDFDSIHPKEFLRMKDRIPGIGYGLIERLLKLKWHEPLPGKRP